MLDNENIIILDQNGCISCIKLLPNSDKEAIVPRNIENFKEPSASSIHFSNIDQVLFVGTNNRECFMMKVGEGYSKVSDRHSVQVMNLK